MNYLKNLPKLPKKLKILFCHYNDLYYLPELPESLEVLHCHGNQNLIRLEKLPFSLNSNYFDYDKDKIKFIDNLEYNFFTLKEITSNNDLLKFYYNIRIIQIRFKLKYKNRKIREIRKYIDIWLDKPICKDNKAGINIRIGWKEITKEIKKIKFNG
jgi:hypothetical protein